jgi:hypothetical protein
MVGARFGHICATGDIGTRSSLNGALARVHVSSRLERGPQIKVMNEVIQMDIIARGPSDPAGLGPWLGAPRVRPHKFGAFGGHVSTTTGAI